MDRGIIIDILPNRKKETLVAHFKQICADFCNQITDVSCDYWDAYITTSKLCFPNAKITLDRFHVTKLLNNVLNHFRKEPRRRSDKEIAYR